MNKRTKQRIKIMAALADSAQAIETALDYFEETRHGKEWIDNGGLEAIELRAALAYLTETKRELADILGD